MCSIEEGFMGKPSPIKKLAVMLWRQCKLENDCKKRIEK